MVDAGANTKSKDHIIQNMEHFLELDEQKIWEYVIFTHPDSDHIENASSVFELFCQKNNNEYKYKLANIIDFHNIQSLDELTKNDHTLYDSYVQARDKVLAIEDSITVHHSARKLTEGGESYTFKIAPETYLTILYNYYYDHNSGSKNNISVCFMITKDEQKLLFTGDLEETGEKYLIENNRILSLLNEKSVDLENVTFFKAGHHGSRTSNTEKFIDHIRPAYVAISCTADTTQFNFTNVQNRFPSSSTMTNFFKYTDYIYITNKEVLDSNGNRQYQPYHGNILFVLDGINVMVYSTNNCYTNNVAKIISETTWFIENRYESIYVYTFDEPQTTYGSCTLIKYGHYDIIIDCGSSNVYSTYYYEQLKKYCVDGVIEYVILTHAHEFNYNKIISLDGNGILDNYKVLNIYDFRAKVTTHFAKNPAIPIYQKYINFIKENEDEVYVKSVSQYENEIIIQNKLSFEIIASNIVDSHTDDEYSLTTIVHFYKEKFIFVGDLPDFSNLLENYREYIAAATYFQAPNTYSFVTKPIDFLKTISSGSGNLFTVIGTSLGYRNTNGQLFATKEYCDLLLSGLKKDSQQSYIYPTSYIDLNGTYRLVNGTLVFECSYYNKKINNKSLRRNDASQNYTSSLIFLEESQYYNDLQ